MRPVEKGSVSTTPIIKRCRYQKHTITIHSIIDYLKFYLQDLIVVDILHREVCTEKHQAAVRTLCVCTCTFNIGHYAVISYFCEVVHNELGNGNSSKLALE